MDKALVTTTIKNNSTNARKLNWTGDGAVWVDAGKSLTVPYEVWSKADRKQRASILADCSNNSIELTINIINKDNECVSVPFNPYAVTSGANIGVQSKSVVNNGAKQLTVNNETAEQMNTVKAVTEESKKAAKQFGATVEGAPVKFDTTPEGTSTQGFSVDTDTEIKSTKNAMEASTEEAPTEAAPAEGAPVEDADKKNNARELFAEAVANKQWDAALLILTETFGADKVTFTARTIMTLKDWDTIVEKYSL